MRIIGIDPGVNGYVTELDVEERHCRAIKVPQFKGTRIIDREKLIDYFDLPSVDMIVLEKVGTRPAFSAAAAFVFGGIYFQLHNIIYPYNHSLVLPQEWQKQMIGHGDAGTTKIRAQLVFDTVIGNQRERWMTHDFIDSFLIGSYYLNRKGIFIKNWSFSQLK